MVSDWPTMTIQAGISTKIQRELLISPISNGSVLSTSDFGPFRVLCDRAIPLGATHNSTNDSCTYCVIYVKKTEVPRRRASTCLCFEHQGEHFNSDSTKCDAACLLQLNIVKLSIGQARQWYTMLVAPARSRAMAQRFMHVLWSSVSCTKSSLPLPATGC